MRILWLCNIMLPGIARNLGLEASNKEGWLTGLSDALLLHREETGIELGVCFPVGKEQDGLQGRAEGFCYFGFYEDTVHEERYDARLEKSMALIVGEFQPDIVHIFGTEFAHTLAMVRAFGRPERTLVGLQGICYKCAAYYTADLPERIINRALFRDVVKQDSIRQQKQKFVLRGEREKEVLKLAGHVTGRTAFDRDSAFSVNPKLCYHAMNETMRGAFYRGRWEYASCEKHRIFVSQGNYPLKGLHYALEAAALLRGRYPDLKLYVAGDVITAYDTWKEKLKISSYGRYLRELIQKYGLQKQVIFCGRLKPEEMKEQYLKANVLLCPSSIENSPNSVGEAMLLGVPVISSDRGGVRSMLEDGREGWLFPAGDAAALAQRLEEVFAMGEAAQGIGRAAAERAAKTHDAEHNYRRLLEIYHDIARQNADSGTGMAEKGTGEAG